MQDLNDYRISTADRTRARQKAIAAIKEAVLDFHDRKMMYDDASVWFVYDVSDQIIGLLRSKYFVSTALLAEQTTETNELFSAHSRFDPDSDEISDHLSAYLCILLKSAAIDLRLPELAFCVNEVTTCFRDWVKTYFEIEPDIHYLPLDKTIEMLSNLPKGNIQAFRNHWNGFMVEFMDTLEKHVPSFHRDLFEKHNFSVNIVRRELPRLSQAYVRPIKRVRAKLQSLAAGSERFQYERERLEQRLKELEEQAAGFEAEGC